jgi:hypothetical protein
MPRDVPPAVSAGDPLDSPAPAVRPPSVLPPPAPAPSSPPPPPRGDPWAGSSARPWAESATQTPFRRRRFGFAPKLMVFLAVLGVIAAAAIPLIKAIDDTIDDIPSFTVDVPDTPSSPGDSPGGGGGGGEKAEPPVGLSRQSMLLRGNLSPALRKLRGEMGGKLMYMRIEAQRVDVQVVRGSKLISAQAPWNGDPRIFPAVTAPSGGKTFAWSAIDPSAPRQFVTAVTRKAGRPSSQFNYAVLIDAIGLEWQVFLKDGTHYRASPDGRSVSRV